MARSETTVANILSAAEDLFLSKNYAEVTMDMIAEGSEVTKGALYHHFSGKEDLYLKMMNADLQAKRELFRGAIASAQGCRERLSRLTQAFLDLPRKKIDLIKLVRRDINVFPEPARSKLVRAYQACLPDVVEEVLRDGIAGKELSPADPRLLSWQFVAMVEVVLGRYAQRVLKDAGAPLDYVLNLFLNGARRNHGTRH